MARDIKVVLTCDVDRDGTEASETVHFGLDGHEYEIELCVEHLEEFNDQVRPYVALGRRIDGTTRRRRSPRAEVAPSAVPSSRRRRARGGGGGEDLQAIREWGRANGMKVSDRGRISQTVREAFAAAQS